MLSLVILTGCVVVVTATMLLLIYRRCRQGTRRRAEAFAALVAAELAMIANSRATAQSMRQAVHDEVRQSWR